MRASPSPTSARTDSPATAWLRIAAGCLALALLLSLELTVVLALRGLTLATYLASRDPVAGAAYLLSLALFAVCPCDIYIYIYSYFCLNLISNCLLPP